MRTLFFLVASALSLQIVSAQEQPVYKNPQAPLEKRVDDLFSRLTQNEKLGLLGGTGFATQPIQRLGVPEMAMADAGQGVRGGSGTTQGPATAFPAGVNMASTWDTNLIAQVGRAIGVEAHNKGTGVQVLLGPAVNIHRSPLGGRNGEYFSEDPYLAARLAVSYIEGMQFTGVAACIKHFACNNQEEDRNGVDAKVSERALREIYLPAFEAGVTEAKVWCVMSSYNLVNGHHSSANHYLLTDILKNEWGFDGTVMSDWGGVHETDAVQDGNDLEMPKGDHMNVAQLKTALANHSVTQAAIDDSVHRILRTIIRVGLLNGPMTQDHSLVNSQEHSDLAYKVATESIVLLKNEHHILPLNLQKTKSLALIGESAHKLQVGALGSPRVKPLKTVEILDALNERSATARAGKMQITFIPGPGEGDVIPASAVTVPGDASAHGFHAEYFTNANLEGQPALVRTDKEIDLDGDERPAPGISGRVFSVRWTANLSVTNSGPYILSFTGDDGFRVFLDDKKLIEKWEHQAPLTLTNEVRLEAGKTYALRIEFFQDGGGYAARLAWKPGGKPNFADAIEAAKASDVAIVCVSTMGEEGEGHDRPSMDLPNNQSALIRAVAAANRHTIVVLNNGTPVTMTNWLKSVPGVIEAWFPGQRGGDAIADILFGNVNPSGKLPDTLATSRSDYPDFGNFPGTNHVVNYAEGIYVGYRHFDKDNLQPLFPFGYGLSYTTFKYKHLALSSATLAPDGTVTVRADITNTGKRAGEEVAELYLHDLKPAIDRPIRELKGFAKVALQPGETKTVQFTITPRDLAYYDVPGAQWKADAGNYEIEIGASSRNLRLKKTIHLTADFTQSPSDAQKMIAR
ncbi:MAG TPA: glycoside hydrolase family 3 C-terminal domain-containing protein [Candidatus Angelobacter sp.]|nr:glycoside hydrolase family 3 C-terminal domain-containing protein [Candidatus Angelobacter sp.]